MDGEDRDRAEDATRPKKKGRDTTRPKKKGRDTNTPRSRANAKQKEQAKAKDRAGLRALRALDLLVVYGRDKAIESLAAELNNLRWAEVAVEQAERYLDEHKSETGKAEARAVYKARLDFLFYESVCQDDMRNARQIARDKALVQGVILSDEQAPGTTVGHGLDVSALSDDERAELRTLLDRVRERRAREGAG